MTFIEILYMITGPAWLRAQINMISLLFAGAVLVYFGSFVHGKIILPLGDWIRHHTNAKMSQIQRVSKFANIIGSIVATIFFLLYVYFGSYILAEFVFAPILFRLENYILIVTIVLFAIVSYALNTLSLRKKFM